MKLDEKIQMLTRLGELVVSSSALDPAPNVRVSIRDGRVMNRRLCRDFAKAAASIDDKAEDARYARAALDEQYAGRVRDLSVSGADFKTAINTLFALATRRGQVVEKQWPIYNGWQGGHAKARKFLVLQRSKGEARWQTLDQVPPELKQA